MKHDFLSLPSQHRLKELFDYDPDTGLFTRKLARKGPKGSISGCISNGYISIGIDYGLYMAHRLAWVYMTGNDPDPMEIDHINNNRMDNRWANLRLSDNYQNAQNVKRLGTNTSGYKGVYYDKARNKYCAEIICKRIKYRLGRFDTAEEAAEAYKQAAHALHQDFSAV